MASLGEVIGALISQIGKGRSQADMATLEIAQIYKKHPLLSGFSVPKMTLDEVVVDLKVSIASSPTTGNVLAPKAKAEVLVQLEGKISDLIRSEPSLNAICQKFPEFEKFWKSTYKQLIERLSNLIPAETEVETKAVSLGVASTIMGFVSSALFAPVTKVEITAAKKIINTDVPEIENRLTNQIQEIILKVLKTQPPLMERLDVLVTASELQSISPEKLTTLKLSLRETDQIWTQIEAEKGEIKEKLVPS